MTWYQNIKALSSRSKESSTTFLVYDFCDLAVVILIL